MSGEGILLGARWPRKAFALSTPDPQFDPTGPVTVNGYAFEPAQHARDLNAMVEDDDMGAAIDG